MDNISLGIRNKLYTLRKAKGLTQKHVASAIGISQQAYAQYEIGKSTPSIETLNALANVYEVSLFQFLDPNANIIRLTNCVINGKTFKLTDEQLDLVETICLTFTQKNMKMVINSKL